MQDEAIKLVAGEIERNLAEKERSPHLDMALGRLQAAVDHLRGVAADMAKHLKVAGVTAPGPAVKGK